MLLSMVKTLTEIRLSALFFLVWRFSILRLSLMCLSIMRLSISILLICATSFSAFAIPETCIQDPQRTLECPRIKYKMAFLTDKESGEKVRQLICICLTDFEDLLVEPENEVAKSMKRRELRSWTRTFGITEEELKELVKY